FARDLRRSLVVVERIACGLCGVGAADVPGAASVHKPCDEPCEAAQTPGPHEQLGRLPTLLGGDSANQGDHRGATCGENQIDSERLNDGRTAEDDHPTRW